jgi:hypothetical protein
MLDFIVQYWIEFLFGLVVLALSTAFEYLRRKLKAQVRRQKALENGICSLLRAEMIRSGEKYLEKGWCAIYAKDAFDKEYKAYHELGGNGTMTEMHEQVMNLPTTRERG